MQALGSSDGHPVNGLIGTIFSQRVAREYFGAGQAGLYYGAGMNTRGPSFNFHGFSPMLPNLVEDIVRDFGSRDFWTSVDPVLFENSKERLIRYYYLSQL